MKTEKPSNAPEIQTSIGRLPVSEAGMRLLDVALCRVLKGTLSSTPEVNADLEALMIARTTCRVAVERGTTTLPARVAAAADRLDVMIRAWSEAAL